jgi:hypothetical protein
MKLKKIYKMYKVNKINKIINKKNNNTWNLCKFRVVFIHINILHRGRTRGGS